MMKNTPKFVLAFISVFFAGFLVHMYLEIGISNPDVTENSKPLKSALVMDDVVNSAEKSTLKELRKKLEKLTIDNQKLLDVNEKLRRDLEAKGKRTVMPVSFPELTRRIDAIPDFLIEKQLSYFFDDDFVSNIDDKKEFSKNLLDAALGDDTDDDNLPNIQITFSTSAFPSNHPLGFNSEVNLYDIIFAHINAESGTNELLVKWMNMDTGEVLMFTRASIIGGQQYQYVLMKPSQGWRTGTYRVSVYSASSSVKLLGSNSYRITSVIDDGSKTANGPNYEYIQELVATGQAVPKSGN